MKDEQLKLITKTVTGEPVKNLKWLPTDNIITGLVKDPILGKAHINDGFVSGQWRKNGTPVNRIKGRTELALDMVVCQAVSTIDKWSDNAVTKVYSCFEDLPQHVSIAEKRSRLKNEELKFVKTLI